MARADLLKKLFSNFKTGDREAFIKVANEIIEDERKKNHGILAEELRMIISNGTTFTPKVVSTLTSTKGNGKEREVSLFEIIYPDKTLSDVVLTDESQNPRTNSSIIINLPDFRKDPSTG